MNKSKIVLIILLGLACVLVIGEAFGIIYYNNSYRQSQNLYQDLYKKFQAVEPGYRKLSDEKEAIEKQYASLLKEHEAVKADRNNLIEQTKSLLADRSRVKELEDYIQKIKAQYQEVGTNNEGLKKENLALQAKNKQFEDSLNQLNQVKIQLEKDKEELKAQYEQTLTAAQLKAFNTQITQLKKEKDNLGGQLNKAQKDMEQLKMQRVQLTEQVDELSRQLNDYKKNYAEAQKKNNSLQQEMRDMPKKFAEIARQNKLLLKNTQKMHYNLGVFYTQKKEYERAISEFVKAIELDPDDAYAHFNLGYIYAEYMVNRKEAIEHFRRYVSLAKSNDKDLDWARKYILTWETFEGKKPME